MMRIERLVSPGVELLTFDPFEADDQNVSRLASHDAHAPPATWPRFEARFGAGANDRFWRRAVMTVATILGREADLAEGQHGWKADVRFRPAVRSPAPPRLGGVRRSTLRTTGCCEPHWSLDKLKLPQTVLKLCRCDHHSSKPVRGL
jgi:hypothetical protein